MSNYGKRYSRSFKNKVAAYAHKHGVPGAAKKFKVADRSVRLWMQANGKAQKNRRQGVVVTPSFDEKVEQLGARLAKNRIMASAERHLDDLISQTAK